MLGHWSPGTPKQRSTLAVAVLFKWRDCLAEQQLGGVAGDTPIKKALYRGLGNYVAPSYGHRQLVVMSRAMARMVIRLAPTRMPSSRDLAGTAGALASRGKRARALRCSIACLVWESRAG